MSQGIHPTRHTATYICMSTPPHTHAYAHMPCLTTCMSHIAHCSFCSYWDYDSMLCLLCTIRVLQARIVLCADPGNQYLSVELVKYPMGTTHAWGHMSFHTADTYTTQPMVLHFINPCMVPQVYWPICGGEWRWQVRQEQLRGYLLQLQIVVWCGCTFLVPSGQAREGWVRLICTRSGVQFALCSLDLQIELQRISQYGIGNVLVYSIAIIAIHDGNGVMTP
jgi:hypothetical protein